MGFLVGRTRHQIQTDFKTIAPRLPVPFALADVFDALTEGFVEPDASDMQIMGRILHRIGFEKFRVRDGGSRKVMWAPKAADIAGDARIDPPSERPFADWGLDLAEWAEEQTKPFRMEDALRAATPLCDAVNITMTDLREGARVLRSAGYMNARVMIEGRQAMRWQRIEE